MLEVTAAILFGILGAYWRYTDGRDNPIRFRNSSLIGTGIVCSAGLFSYLYSVGGWLLVPDRLCAVGIATALVIYIVRVGFEDWTSWKSMLMSRSLPCAAIGVALMSYSQTTGALLLAGSGLLVTIIYVCGAKHSGRYKAKNGTEWMPLGFPTQQWGEMSHGLFVAGLVLV